MIPPPLTAPAHLLCPSCRGTGADAAKTAHAISRGDMDRQSHIRCWDCNGNGLNPAAFFRTSSPSTHQK